jgi:hypothetical protein
MSLPFLRTLTESKIRFISIADDAVVKDDTLYPEGGFKKAAEQYLQTLDESLLVLEGEPNYFVCDLKPKLKEAVEQRRGIYNAAKGAKAGQKLEDVAADSLDILDFMLSTVRSHLVDIEKGGVSVLEKGVSDDVIALLVQNDVIPELFTAINSRQTAAKKAVTDAKKG